ncbi:MAG TPA: hypothetical protein VGO15_04685, partial [Candidatus Limnocylindrales bacterium]|nr:hypothetical protein [Candidatus Limnocylindrales bacterium]
DAVVRARGQIDDDAVELGEGRRKRGRRPHGDRGGVRGADQVGQAGGPDEIVREDRDAGGQSSVSAR